jgi:hypothetical protein
MEALDAIETVLRNEGGPLRYREITDRVLNRKLWKITGKTHDAPINLRLAVDIHHHDREVFNRLFR